MSETVYIFTGCAQGILETEKTEKMAYFNIGITKKLGAVFIVLQNGCWIIPPVL